ncbi:MAG: ferritin family protein [Pontiellaceae bacterium]|nr:ferritin family protein [Pontiellaceae bacterium]MBN2784870.1 ferritin family protein [Pontiellaceae bacterium]
MNTFGTVDAVLDFAIEREQEAVDFYEGLAVRTENESLKKTLNAFAGVEMGHKEKLIAAKAGQSQVTEGGDVVNLKIGDYLVDVVPGPEMTFQDALIVAIKREKAAMDLYTDLEATVSDPSLQALFKKLAREESTHKLSFETAYEKHFLADN